MRVNLRRATAGRRGVTGFVVGVVATMTIAGGGVALAAIPSSSSAKFTGCVAKTGGALRVIDAQAGKKCKSTEKTISWSKGWTHRGAWATGTAYKPGDVITQNGSSYVAKVKSTGASPASSTSAWGLLAAAGATGATGPAGPTGPTGAPGVTGPAGPVAVTYKTNSLVVGSGVTDDVSVSCNELFGSALNLVGGGVTTTSPSTAVRESGPYDSSGLFGDIDSLADDGWTATVNNPTGGNVTVTVTAICVDATSIS